jgi:shikimate dehydrogenase
VISGSTRVAGVIGDPVRHSLSPVLHNAAYASLGLDWVYAAFEVPAGATADALDAARALGMVGLSVTMPHKAAAAAACDDLSPEAKALESVNTVTLAPGGRLEGDSTDGEGFVRSVQQAGHEPSSTPFLVLGAGGAARAVVLALGRIGAEVPGSARRTEEAARTAALAGGTTAAWDKRNDAVADSTFVVNATPIGMGSSDCPLAIDAIDPRHVVVDLVYHPLDTALLRGARSRGAQTVDGLGMLVHQAALQVERWSGETAPVAVMRAAAEQALGRTD